MTGRHWVIGGGGLLGGAVVRRLRANGESVFVSPPIPWSTDDTGSVLESSLVAFLALSDGEPWMIYWCAGAAVTDSTPDALERELGIFTGFLSTLARHAKPQARSGSFFLAASAGAVYGASAGAPFTEDSSTAPLGAYGAAKLRAESALAAFSAGSGIPAVAGRISNLYGPGQSLAKQQGLVSRLCYSHLTRSPISIFVPLDTLRDYIYVDDCADQVIACAQRANSETGYRIKLIVSGQALSVAGVLGHFRQISTVRPLIVSGSSSAAALQSRDLRLRSTVWPSINGRRGVSVVDGMARTLADMRLSYMKTGLNQ